MSAQVITVNNLLRRTRDRYRHVDREIVRQVLPQHPDIKCKQGCAACCYQLVGLTFVEAIILADGLIRNHPTEIDAALARLDAGTALLNNRREYMEQRLPCAFLRITGDAFAGECMLYKSRPLACRLELVVSDPALCAPTGDYEVLRIDTRDAHVKLVHDIVCGNATLAMYGPLPPYVAEAIRMLRDKRTVTPGLLERWGEWFALALQSDTDALEARGIVETYLFRDSLKL